MAEVRKVFSSFIDGIAYDAEAQRLSVHYQNGQASHYDAVPADVWYKVNTAPSIGAALHAHVRGKFNHTGGR